jgi:anti-sigma-K factor RskA
MPETTLRDHLTIVAQLPDFVLGKLDETSLRRVSRHVEICPTCRRELANAMGALGVLAGVPQPPAWVRGAILRRAAAEGQVASRQHHGLTSGSARTERGSSVAIGRTVEPGRDRWRRMAIGQLVPRWALVAASVALLLAGGLVTWSHEHHNGTSDAVSPDAPIAAVVNDATTAYPLDDSDLPVSATGVVFAEPHGREVYLVANGLPVLPDDQRYQVWLFTAQDSLQSAGLVTTEPDGNLRALLQTPAPFTDYVGVALTAEPEEGSAVPTSDLVLGGSFPPAIAALPSLPA